MSNPQVQTRASYPPFVTHHPEHLPNSQALRGPPVLFDPRQPPPPSAARQFMAFQPPTQMNREGSHGQLRQNRFSHPPQSFDPPFNDLQQPLRSYDSAVKINSAKWVIKFDGRNKNMNVQEFIFRVGELKRDFGWPEEEFLTKFHQLLEKPALDWYWNHRKFVHFQT